MPTRFRFHIILLLVLTLFGGWIVYWDLIISSPTDSSSQSGMKAAMYWFGFLSFALMSSLLYRLLRKQALKWLLVAYLSSLSIAILATESLVIIGQHQADRDKQTANLEDNRNLIPHQDAKSVPEVGIQEQSSQ